MNFKKSNLIALIALLLAACNSTKSEISSFKVSGKCRMAEELIKEKYSGQDQLYQMALVHIECSREPSKGLKILNTLASGEYMPAMARLIELNEASPQMIKRYNILKYAAEQAAYERREAQKQRLLSYGQATAKMPSPNKRPMEIDNRCIQDGGTQMCYNRQSQRYSND